MDELGTVRTSKIRFQGSAIGGNPSDNDWRIEVFNEGLQFQQYNPGASPAGYITRQIFGRGKTGVTVTPSSTYNISGKLKLSGGLLLQELPHQSTISSYANLYPFKDDNKLYYLHPDFNNGEPYDLTRPNEIGNLDTGINIHSINSVNESIITTTNGKESMRIISNGYIGIGNTSPSVPLHVTSFKNQSYSGTKVDGLSSTYTVKTGILCDNDCIANNFYYNSDKRIKKEITENNMKNSLEKINMLESVNYKYHNDKKMVGFIGQNVRKVIPEAVSFSEQYVFTIDKMIKFRNYQGRTLMTFDSSHGLNNNRMHGELVQPLTLMMKFNNLIKYIGVNVILSERDVLLDVNLETEYNIEKEVYVAGPKIKDFHVINEQPIISMCVSAIQELTEQCKELQETNRLLINEINSLKSFN